MRITVGFFLLVIIICSCANIGNPTGGPKDVAPPVPLVSIPYQNQLNFRGKQFVIQFDENILLDKPNEKVFISPPLQTPPIVKAYGKKLYVTIDKKEVYQDNTTYTIDFGNSIQDNNEKNPLGEYSLAFSTDSIIDSLKISGYVIYGDNLDPAEGIYVEIYKNDDDSTFRTTVPLRIGKTDETGYFSIKNVSPGTYYIVALKDANRNYKFDQKSEYLGFQTEAINPTVTELLLPDTLWRDSITVDTVTQQLTAVYTPFDILLSLFKETDSSFYFSSDERTIRQRLDFYFVGKPLEAPSISLVNVSPASDQWYDLESSNNQDTLHYWITDSTVYKMDTLRIAYQYLKADSNQIYQTHTDTLFLNFTDVIKKKKKKKDELPEQELLKLSTNATGSLNIHDTIQITSPTPIASIVTASICLEMQKDSTREDIPIELRKKNLRTYQVIATIKPGNKYFLRLDSAAIYSIYGITNKDLESSFTLRTKESYTEFQIALSNAPQNFRIQLLNPSDVVVRDVDASRSVVKFKLLEPGDYYVRGYVDSNQNQQWDTGNYGLKQQAEQIYYLNKKVSLKVNWNVTEPWDVTALDLLEQKPMELQKKIKRDKAADSM